MTDRTVPPEARIRLVKLLGLLASDQDGEVLAAARASVALLRKLELGWQDVCHPPAQLAAPPVAPAVRTWVAVAEQLLTEHFGMLRDKELSFVTDILGRGRGLTIRQSNWLASIASRAGISGWQASEDDLAEFKPSSSTVPF